MATDPATSSDLTIFGKAIAAPTDFAAVVAKTPELRALAEEIFAAPIIVEIEDDPEISDKQYVVLTVETNESLEKIARQRDEWYQRTYGVLENHCEFVQLVVNVTS